MAAFPVARASAGSSNGGTSVTTAAKVTTGANLIVLSIASASNNATPSDSLGNTWTGLTGQSTGNGAIKIYYCFNPTTGAAHTFTATGGAPSIVMYAFSNVASSPFDQQNGTQSSAAGQTNMSTGSITPTTNEQLIVAACAGGVIPETITNVGNYNIYNDEISLSGGQHYSISVFFLMQKTAAAVNPNFAFASTTGTAAAAIASFKTNTNGASGGSYVF